MKNRFCTSLLLFSLLFFSCEPFFFLDDDEPKDDSPKEIKIDDFTASIDKGTVSLSDLCTLSLSGMLDSHFSDAKITVRLYERSETSYGGKAYSAFNLIDDAHDFVYKNTEFINEISESEYDSITRACEISFYDTGYYFLSVEVDADTSKKNSYVTPYKIEFPIYITE